MKKEEILLKIISNQLAQIYVILLEIMVRVGKGSATIRISEKVLEYLQKKQATLISSIGKDF